MERHDLLENYNFTTEEAIIFEWQFDMMGSFFKNLMQAIMLADGCNLEKISRSYPHHVEALLQWRNGTLWRELTAKMDKNPEVFGRFRL